MWMGVPPPDPEALFHGFTWTNATTIISAVLAAASAGLVAVVGYSRQKRAARRDERAKGYAEALRAVEDYLEAPYLIRRRDGSTEARKRITQHISDVQSRISFYSGWLRIHAPLEVAQAYDEYVAASRRDAGSQMTQAWKMPPTRRDRHVPLGSGYIQPEARRARLDVLTAMRRDLGVR